MVKIPTPLVQPYEQRIGPGLDVPRTPRVSPRDVDTDADAIPRALQGLGAASMQMAGALEQRNEAEENSWISRTTAEDQVNWTKRELELREGAGPGAPDYVKKVEDEWKKYRQDRLNSAPSPRAKEVLGQRYNTMEHQLLSRSIVYQGEERNRKMVGDYGASVEARAAAVRANPALLNETLAMGDGDYNAAAKTWMTPEQAQQGKTIWRDKIVAGAVEGYRDMAKQAAATGDGAAAHGYLRNAEDLVGKFYGARPVAPEGRQGREQSAMQFFESRGYTKAQAAGIVGNLIAESGMDPGARAPGDARDKTDSVGIAQWNMERRKALQEFAAKRGKPAGDFETQLAFIDHELRTSERGAGDRLRGARNADEAAAAFIGYERPKGWTPENPRGGMHWDRRAGNARRLAGGEPGAPIAPSATTGGKLYGMVDSIRDDIDRGVKSAQTQAKATAKAEYDTWFNEFKTGLADGSYGMSDIKAAREAGRLTDFEDIQKAHNALDGFDKKATEKAAALAIYQSGGQFNSADDKSLKLANVAYDALGGANGLTQNEPGAVHRTREFIERTGIVPEAAVNTAVGMTRAPASETMMQGYQMLDSFYRQNPDATARSLKSGDFDRLQDWQAWQQFYTPNEVQERMRKSVDPQFAAAREKVRDEGMKLAADISDSTVLDLFDPSYLPFNQPGQPVVPAQMAQLRSDFARIFADRYSMVGDKTIAAQQAAERLKTVWGGSDTNGGRLMRYPPEKYYPPIDGSHGWMRKQLETDLKEHAPGYKDYALQATPATEARPGSGYLVSIIKDDGTIDLVRDKAGNPLSVRFDPTTLQEERRQKFLTQRSGQQYQQAPALGELGVP
jgi:hypothetical protein